MKSELHPAQEALLRQLLLCADDSVKALMYLLVWPLGGATKPLPCTLPTCTTLAGIVGTACSSYQCTNVPYGSAQGGTNVSFGMGHQPNKQTVTYPPSTPQNRTTRQQQQPISPQHPPDTKPPSSPPSPPLPYTILFFSPCPVLPSNLSRICQVNCQEEHPCTSTISTNSRPHPSKCCMCAL